MYVVRLNAKVAKGQHDCDRAQNFANSPHCAPVADIRNSPDAKADTGWLKK